MNKAFIFDLDGVLINNEPQWEKIKKDMYRELFGMKIYKQMGTTVGLDMHAIYKRAFDLGAQVSEKQLLDSFDNYAHSIYTNTPITEGIEELGEVLLKNNYKIGIVWASPLAWMNLVIDRLSFKGDIMKILSLEERSDLGHKPAPDGYREAINELKSIPLLTMILEDSNAGIESAKRSGAYVIGLKQNLVPGYEQKNADVYVENVTDITPLITNLVSSK